MQDKATSNHDGRRRARLSNGERIEVLALRGLVPRQIAERLGMKPRAVRYQLRRRGWRFMRGTGWMKVEVRTEAT